MIRKFEVTQLLFVVFFVFMNTQVFSFETVGSIQDRYLYLLSIQGKIEKPNMNIHSLSFNRWDVSSASNDHPWKNFLDSQPRYQTNSDDDFYCNLVSPEMKSGFNTAYSSGYNDGAAWQGKGINSSVRGGVKFEYNNFTAILYPELHYAQNLEYQIMSSSIDSEFGYITTGIDFPQRFGDEPLYYFSFGQSEIRYELNNVSIGFGNQNIWLGPAYKNAIVLSNNAPGFPKIDLSLRKTKTKFGDFEAMLIWGRLTQSDFFILPEDNPYRESEHNLFTGLTISYAPTFIPGFTLGLNRTAISKWEDTNFNLLTMMFNPFMSSDLGSDGSGQIASVTLDWRFPGVNFDIYAEWARNDYSPGLRDNILLAPEHSQGYTIGGCQIIDTPKGFFALQGEITELIKSRTYEINSLGTNPFGGQSGFYSHHIVTQGYTHLGQLLGAGIGSGSDSQYLSLDYYHERGMIGSYIQRISKNKDYLYGDDDPDRKDPEEPYLFRLNVEIIFGLHGAVLLENFVIGFDSGVGYNINRDFIMENDVLNCYISFDLVF